MSLSGGIRLDGGTLRQKGNLTRNQPDAVQTVAMVVLRLYDIGEVNPDLTASRPAQNPILYNVSCR
jgi:hypothetical protein